MSTAKRIPNHPGNPCLFSVFWDLRDEYPFLQGCRLLARQKPTYNRGWGALERRTQLCFSVLTSPPVSGRTHVPSHLFLTLLPDFIFLGSRITADGDCSHEIKRRLLLGRKVMTNLDSMLKSRDVTLPTKVRLVKAMVFPVVMYGCESWTVKKAECRKIYGFELWCWTRFLRVHWTARRSNQSILKEISPGCSLEGLLLRLKLQYFGHLMQRVDSL